MGKKRNTVVVLSSDDERDRSTSSSRPPRTRSNSKLSSTVPRANPARSKKPRLSDSSAFLFKDTSNWAEIKGFCEDFDDTPTGFKVSDGSGESNQKELWVDKYKPHSLEELAVHKRKIEEVKLWFEERLGSSKDENNSKVIVITGQAGVGKSATVHAIACHFGARLCEWNTPTPIIWQEHLHNSSTGLRYMSKLDEFEYFVERVRKYGLIPPTDNMESKESVILLIDDLPVTNGKVAFGRLRNSLYLLVRSIQIPTAILVTNYGEADSGDHTTQYLEELQLSLENAGACKVAFNPITHNSTKKILSRICRLEQCKVSVDQIDLIAKASGGDIRHAITSLQFFCVKPSLMRPLSSPNHPTSSREKLNEINIMDEGFSLEFGRDETLSLFHALGKFLHNKRETENVVELVGDEFSVQERLARLPLKLDAPEKILCQAHGQARPIADFLNENVLDFLSDDAIDDAWTVASYLGDVDLLLGTFRGMLARRNEAENVLQSAAASVAVRGVLFGNHHPVPSRWHAIRRPKLWQVEQLSLSNKKEMVKRRYDTCCGMSSSDFSVIATEYTPVFKWLGSDTHESLDQRIDMMSLDDQESVVSEDEIEDW
ncbi:cell cycle checkpoint protein RAD17 isoform X1 [Humulus lupulus]|uniref:cell cycle checkpoint protein RAD17 isoform X1 n=1 Tax=Humulus lupulus TaxID=3486 RepID=UPI002B409DF5|nr:cell cycle checkpoint protein RAD17 isoform X1 [Humulus lupulus]